MTKFTCFFWLYCTNGEFIDVKSAFADLAHPKGHHPPFLAAPTLEYTKTER